MERLELAIYFVDFKGRVLPSALLLVNRASEGKETSDFPGA